MLLRCSRQSSALTKMASNPWLQNLEQAAQVVGRVGKGIKGMGKAVIKHPMIPLTAAFTGAGMSGAMGQAKAGLSPQSMGPRLGIYGYR